MATGFGIVGCGMIANFHAKAIENIRNAKLVGCFDMIPQAVDRFAGEQGCTGYHQPGRHARQPGGGSRHHLHAERGPHGPGGGGGESREARDRRKAFGNHAQALRCESSKPAKTTRCNSGTIMPSRFSPANIELKNAIEKGRFGKLTLGDTYVKWWRSQEYYDSGGWRGTWKLDGGGAYMNQAIHNVDLLYWFMGDVAEVCGPHRYPGSRADRSRRRRGRVRAVSKAEPSACWKPRPAPFRDLLKRTEIHGTSGSAIVEQDNIKLWSFAKEVKRDAEVREKYSSKAGTGGAADPKAIDFTGHMLQFKDFLKAIGERRKAFGRWLRRPQKRGDHSGDLQILLDRPPRGTPAEIRPKNSQNQLTPQRN